MRSIDSLPARQSMRKAHRVRKFRRGNAEHGRAYLGTKPKPWKQHTDMRSTAAA
jgi:hypothetical protein